MIRIAALAAVAALVAVPAFAQKTTVTTTRAVGTAAPTVKKTTVHKMKSTTNGPAGKSTTAKKVTKVATPAGTKTTTMTDHKG